MKKSSKRSNRKGFVVYLCAVTIGAAALSAGVALGFLINVHSYMHAPAVNGSKASAIASNPGAHVL